MGIKFEDEIQGLWLLGTLPDSWETFRTSLSNSTANGIITMELAKGSILNEEMRRKSQGSSSHSDVLVTESRGRSQSKGHTVRYCRQLKRENKKANYINQKNNHKKDDGGNDSAEANTTTDEFFICCDYDMVNVAHDDSSWVVDCGATCHVTSQRDFYTSYTPGDFGSVKMGNSGLSKIVGVGDICKQNRVTFKIHSPSRKERILDLVHSDVCGPMKTRSLGGCSYFVTFIDDHSRKVWVYSLKSKNQVFDVFKQFHALVERQTGKNLKCIRTDNRGEYIGPFDAYCREKGIRHQKSPPKTPQLNGLAERMNRTLAERVRCLFSHAGLPNSFWGEALNTAVHVINLTPCVPLSFDVPDRVWRGKDVSYNHLRVFGCKAFVHIPKDERSKLDVKTKPCIFLGYGQDEFGYRLYDPVLKKLPQSGDETQVDEQHEDGDVINPELPILDMPAFVSLRRSTRDRHPSTHFSADEYVLLTDGGEPECYAEAMEDEHKREWVEAMQDEMNSLYENNTFELVKLPKGKRALKNKWVYKLKTEEHTSRPRYKARLVVKGFSQRKGIDFDEIFSPVLKMSSIRVILGLAASLDLEVEQMDVKTAFLHGDLDKEIYMEQPEGFQVKGKEDYVCKLQKSLYGLK
ncbi:hypothetical protein E3N88_11166 [Mikania micrantha]|uniref:Integrase catalytic domain-containing protein n=1 Tax=Mikania micrantha TaxID=192012 RepID=A0A5N6PCR7_9ASTR|nr:hypothetical protein E3N88_11166 [Mikania micrantha]